MCKRLNSNLFFESAYQHDFFGYFNKSPISLNKKFIVFHSSNFKGRMPSQGEKIKIILYDTLKKTYSELDNTASWNWQIGSMLQWLDQNTKVIYNTFEYNNPSTIILDVQTNIKERHPYNFITVNKNLSCYLSINFNLLNDSRVGYGYNYGKKYNKDFYFIEYNYLKKKINFKLDKKFFQKKNNSFKNHSLEHFEYSPSGNMISFIERWDISNSHRFSRLVIMDRKSKKYLFTTNCGRLTHYIWLNDNSIVYFGSSSSLVTNKFRNQKPYLFNKLLKFYKFLKFNKINFIKNNLNGDGFKLLDLKLNQVMDIPIDKKYGDGHPTYNQSQNKIFIDTYPDTNGNCYLYSFDFNTNFTDLIHEFKVDTKSLNSGYRTDLHPKISFSNDLVFLDYENSHRRMIKALKI